MNVSTYCIKHPVPAIVLFVLLTLAGLLGFQKLQIQDSPDVEFPYISITTSSPGASPQQLEKEVAVKLEKALASVTDIRHIYTTISDGVVNIDIEFRLEKDTADALSDVRDAVSSVRSELPATVHDPVFTKSTTSGEAFMHYTVSSPNLSQEALSWFVDNEVNRTLSAVKGVGKLTRVGGVDREVLVALQPATMQAIGVTAADVSRQLQRVQQEAAGGRADVSGARQSIRTLGALSSASELAALELPLPNSANHVRLDQVARVSDTVAEPTSMALLDGKPVVGFEVTRSKGASEVSVAQGVQQALDTLRKRFPHISVSEIYSTTDRVHQNYRNSMSLLYEGAMLTILVVWAFLRSWRATGISAVALPLSIIPAFALMVVWGFSLNGVTLLSLTLVVGILVDDAIVEIENIVRHLRMGKTPYQAAIDAASEIGLAVVATTFTLVAVFLPTAFMSGIVGRFFKQFGWTTVFAVLASLAVARMLTPMMAAYWLKPTAANARAPSDSRTMRRYLDAVDWSLLHRGRVVLLALALFVVSMALVPLLPMGFIPPEDVGYINFTLELQPGSTLVQAQERTEAARQIVQQDPDVAQVFTVIGRTDERIADQILVLKPRAQRQRSQQTIATQIRERLLALSGVRLRVDNGGDEVQVLLTGDDPQVLASTAQNVQREIRGIGGLGNIYSSISLVRPEVVVRPDLRRAADQGVTAAAIGDTLRVATAGDYDLLLPKLNLPDRQIPIRVRFPESARADLDFLRNLPVPANQGTVALGSVADIAMGSGPARVDRLDRSRRVIIHIELNGKELGTVMDKVNLLPSLAKLPPGITRGEIGDAEIQQEMFSGFATAMLAGVLCVYLVLVLLFKSFLHPVSILAALPLAVGGAFAALLLTGHSFSMPSLIGLLMLMGIAVKNSILLVEYAIVARTQRGLERHQALLDACHKRARPIIMTTIAMGAGMLPVALSGNAVSSFNAPMAVTVIGGLITSTFLSLLIIPVVYTYVDDFAAWVYRRWHGKQTRQDAATGSQDD